MVLAAPLGSYLGSVIGWRGAFLCVAPIAALALLWMLTRTSVERDNRFGSSVTGLQRT